MGKLFIFMMVSLDGYFEGKDHDLSWHNVDSEFNTEFAIPQLKESGTLLFGKNTYDLMKNYWSSENARRDDPEVAGFMNNLPKIVVSSTLQSSGESQFWRNVTVVKENVAEQIKKIKENSQKDIAVFGSSKLCVFLLEQNLIDEIRIMINPIVIGQGTPLFLGIKDKIKFKLSETKKFNNGNVLLKYFV